MTTNARLKAVLILSFAFLGITVGFQNCGGFRGLTASNQSTSSSLSTGVRGNNVKEAGLAGKNVVSNLTVASVAAGGQSRLVTCAADQSTCLATGMPLLNQNEMPTPYASMYCVPTSAAMVFETFQRAGFTFPRNEGVEFSALTTSEQRTLWLGNRMQTTDQGTYGNFESNVVDGLIWSATPGYELASRGSNVTPIDMKNDALKNGIALLSYGHYYASNVRTLVSGRRAADLVRNGGHSIAINGYRTNAGGQIETIYNDPWDKTQYARVFERVPLKGGDVDYNFPYVAADGSTSNYTVFTYGSGVSLGVEMIDAYYPLVASSAQRVIPGATAVDPAVAAAQAVVQAAYQNALGRAADPAGLASYTPSVMAGLTQDQVEAQLRQSDEYKAAHPTVVTVPTPIVVPPPPAPVTVVTVEQPYNNLRTGDGLVRALYLSVLKRTADQSGIDYFSSMPAPAIAHQIAASPEAFNIYRPMSDSVFVSYLYNNLLFRQPAQWEIDFWTGELSSGRITRTQAVDGFANSPEFGNLTAR